MQMQTETKKKSNVPAVQNANTALAPYAEGWGTEGVDATDILLPKILLMQGLSEAVAQEKAQMGDFLNSVTGQVIGSGREKDKQPLGIIPINTFKTWVEYEKIGDKLEFIGIVPVTSANAHWKMEDEVDGKLLRRDRCLNFYVLLVGDEQGLPYLLTFRRTSYRTGQKLATHFMNCELAARRGKPVPPAATTFKLDAVKTQNDQGIYYVLQVEPMGPTPEESLKLAFDWYQTIKKNAVKVDNSDLAGSAAPSAEAVDSEMNDRF